MKKGYIPPPVIARMPRYYRCIEELDRSGCIRVSSNTLAARLDLTASQIRQDFSCFGEFGQQGYGYNVKSLKVELDEILGMNNRHTAILIGCGNLGHALIKNFDFDRCGFWLLSAFDIGENIVGTVIDGVAVLHIDELEEYTAMHSPDIAILTSPRNVAQEIVNRLVSAGIRGIWNFTNYELTVKNPKVLVENVIFSDSLMTLSYRLSETE